uniref:Uncharacterized protein n=1 Tax=Amazona collaria TaxID=241587 RepID=A0A8B9FJX1_9PSIT
LLSPAAHHPLPISPAGSDGAEQEQFLLQPHRTPAAASTPPAHCFTLFFLTSISSLQLYAHRSLFSCCLHSKLMKVIPQQLLTKHILGRQNPI